MGGLEKLARGRGDRGGGGGGGRGGEGDGGRGVGGVGGVGGGGGGGGSGVGGVWSGGQGVDFVALDGRFRVATALKVYTLLSAGGWVLLSNCERAEYAEVFNFYDLAHVLGGGGGNGGGQGGGGGGGGGGSLTMDVGADGGLSLGSGRQLSASRPIGGGGGGDSRQTQMRCLLRRKTGSGAPAVAAAEAMYLTYMSTDGGGHELGI